MTDKEMAVNWIRLQGWNEETLPSDEFVQMVQAFLAGLKADRPKWHKVADGDLPKEQKEYWCKVFFFESEETFNAFLWFDLKTKDFKFLEEIEENVESSFRVKSWCEISKLEEE